MPQSDLTATIPRTACRAPCQQLTLSKPTKFVADPTAEPALPRGPFKMLARTGDPIYHYWWGWVIHDMAGFTASKDTICVDYCHDCDEIIGIANEQSASDAGLEITGELIAFRQDDRAAEVLFRSAEGTPYQSSIDFDYSRVEYLETMATTEVNGQSVTGPMYIVRQWTVGAVAVCPYGADSGTSTETDFADNPNSPQAPRTITLFSNGVPIMPGSTTPAAPAAAAVPEPTKLSAAESTPAPDKAAIAAEIRAELTKFMTKFGADNGGKWFSEGKSYSEALELHADALATQLTASKTALTDSETKLKSIDRGEAAPASATDFEKSGGGGTKPAANAHLGDGFAKFSAGVKLPK
jgi:hypothetical protein